MDFGMHKFKEDLENFNVDGDSRHVGIVPKWSYFLQSIH